MPNAGPPPQRRPGDGNNFDRPTVPSAGFLGSQSSDGNNAGMELAFFRLVRWIAGRVTRRKGV